MTEPTTAASAPAAGGDFEVMPYISRPFPQSAPPRLAALATLFGLGPPAVSEARVLELGCAAGGNIIPLALRFPGARFRGVDLAERHVRDGRARIAALAAVRDKLVRLNDAKSGLEPTGAALEAAAALHVDRVIERLANARLVS